MDDILSLEEIDALGEIGNLSMGTSATTLFNLLGKKVNITTPIVKVTNWKQLASDYILPVIVIRIQYKMGLIGSNLMILKERDVKIIADLMMGGDGTNLYNELSDLHLSIISETINQMVGSAATSMSSMFNKKIDIVTPKAISAQLDGNEPFGGFEEINEIVTISYKIIVGNLIDSEIMQILPLSFAKDLVDNLKNADLKTEPIEQQFQKPQKRQPEFLGRKYVGSDANIKPANFQMLKEAYPDIDKSNNSLIMDVPLSITVELGKTEKKIQDVLEFSTGSIIELDKQAGEALDILVNGKVFAKGEVVIIDESFGVRITDIIKRSKRI